jgi:hypothetical protein
MTPITTEKKEFIFIEDLNLTKNTFNCLKRNKIETIQQIINIGYEKLTKINYIKKPGADEIAVALINCGFEDIEPFKHDNLDFLDKKEPVIPPKKSLKEIVAKKSTEIAKPIKEKKSKKEYFGLDSLKWGNEVVLKSIENETPDSLSPSSLLKKV